MVSAILACVFPACALAYNGLYLAGYGTESLFMGGADVAVARDAFAATNNPSGMTQLSGQALDIEMVNWYAPNGSHTDTFGNYRKTQANFLGGYGNAAYARRFENSPFAVGAAFVIQGGVGWTYSGLNTPFGTSDDAAALFTIVKFAPAVAWKVNDSLSLGAELGINYFTANQELFPNTVTPGFSGFRFKDASGIGLNSKWGLQYRPAQDVTIGLTYGTQTSIPMKNGTLRVNLPGLGVVRYDNAKMIGFRLPEELAVGISFRPAQPLLISLQEKWYNWSDAINKLQITATRPRNAAAPAVYAIPSAPDFNDQHVYEAGFAYDYDENTVLLGGINYGKDPLPNQNLSPVFAPIQSLHYMLGVSRKISAEWQVAGGFELYVPRKVTYDSPLFGHSTAKSDGRLLHFSIDRRW